jgi:hypothetical protein
VIFENGRGEQAQQLRLLTSAVLKNQAASHYDPIPGTKCRIMMIENMIAAKIAIKMRSLRT